MVRIGGVFVPSDSSRRAALGLAGDGVADDTAALRRAILSIPSRGLLWIPAPPVRYRITDDLPLSRPITIEAEGAEIHQATPNAPGFAISSSEVTLRGVRATSTAHLAGGLVTTRAISAVGTAAAPLEGLVFEHCTIEQWAFYGLYLQHVSDFEVLGVTARDLWYAGVMMVSAQHGKVRDARVDNVVGAPLAYGIQATRAETDSLVTDPRSSDIRIIDPDVSNVSNWEGVGSHGGERITVKGGSVRGCYRAVSFVPADNASQVETFAPLDFAVDGVTITSGVADGTPDQGIAIAGAMTGAAVVEHATGRARGNLIRGHGQAANPGNLGAAILAQATRGLLLEGHVIHEPGQFGINMYVQNQGFVINGATVVDPWSDTWAAPAAVATRSGDNNGVIGGVVAERGAKVATYVLVNGIRLDGAGNAVVLGVNDLTDAPTKVQGTANARLAFHGATPVARPAVAGSRGGNAALADTLADLASIGVITDGSTA